MKKGNNRKAVAEKLKFEIYSKTWGRYKEIMLRFEEVTETNGSAQLTAISG